MTVNGEARLLKRVNLNLLYSLYAILNSESLSQAADLVSLTQPAISQALKKLRAIFEDELFLQAGGERRLTPLAEALKPRVEHILQESGEVFALRLTFDPATSSRTFRIAAPESILTMFLGPLVAQLRSIAPGIRLSFLKLDNVQQSGPLAQELDMRVGPNVSPAGTSGQRAHQRLLYRDQMVCLAWQDNARFDHIISLEELARAELIGGEGGLLPKPLLGNPISDVIDRCGFAMETDSLASLPAMIVGTQLIALTPSWLAQYYSAFHPLKLISFPQGVGEKISVFAQWHPRHADDPAILWLVDQLLACARELGASAEDQMPIELQDS